MEVRRPSLAIVTASNEWTRMQHPAKAVQHLAEHDLGYRGIEVDVDRGEYAMRANRDPFDRIRTRSADNSLVAILVPGRTDGKVAPKFLTEVAAIRTTAQRDVPTFVLSGISGEKVEDLGDNMYRGQANSITLFESLRDLGATAPPASPDEPNAGLAADLQRIRDPQNRLELALAFDEIGSSDEDLQIRFGYAIDNNLFASDWARGYARHYSAYTQLEDILSIADNARFKREAKSGILYKAPPRNIAFGFWFNAIEGYNSPIVQIWKEGDSSEEALRRIGPYILEEQQAIPVNIDGVLIDQSYTSPYLF